jgi:hypothetical protein
LRLFVVNAAISNIGRGNDTIIAKIKITPNNGGISSVAILIGRTIIDIGIIGKRFDLKIRYLDGPRHSKSPSLFSAY